MELSLSQVAKQPLHFLSRIEHIIIYSLIVFFYVVLNILILFAYTSGSDIS